LGDELAMTDHDVCPMRVGDTQQLAQPTRVRYAVVVEARNEVAICAPECQGTVARNRNVGSGTGVVVDLDCEIAM
jgi:hypothetical protein